jgi:hypothetical protein
MNHHAFNDGSYLPPEYLHLLGKRCHPSSIQEATSRLQITTNEDTRLKCRNTHDRGRNSTGLKKRSERKYNCYFNLTEILLSLTHDEFGYDTVVTLRVFTGSARNPGNNDGNGRRGM